MIIANLQVGYYFSMGTVGAATVIGVDCGGDGLAAAPE